MIDKILLFPYYLVLKLRNRAYDKGRLKSVVAPVPTICVGNITVGGTGKTPHTEMILNMLQESDRWGSSQLAVLSRGYKRESKGFQQVCADSSAAMMGDEPLQIKKKFQAVTVAVDKNRIEGCEFLCDPESIGKKKAGRKCWNKDFPKSDLIILDDAYQYRKLSASLNIVLVDWSRPTFKDHLMPIGRLRDLPERVAQADIIIVSKCPYELEPEERMDFIEKLGVRNYDLHTFKGESASGKLQSIYFTKINYELPQPLFDTTDCRYAYSKRLILFTGIAKDKPLRKFLSDSYKIVRHYSFPDHHRYTWSDIQKIQKASEAYPTAVVATTEKDAQRVLDYNGLPESLRERLIVVPIKVAFLSPEEDSAFRNELDKI